MFGLGFSSGLPLTLTGQTLSAWMTDEHVDLKTIGAFSLVGLAYSFKWIWSCVFDRFSLPWLGRRRGWILLLQLGLAASIAAMGCVNPRTTPGMMVATAILTALFSASLDVVVDAHRADLLSSAERAAGTAAYVMGYRTGILLAGTLALILADLVRWSVVYWLIAGLMAMTTITAALAEEPTTTTTQDFQGSAPSASFFGIIARALHQLFAKKAAVFVLLFVVLYKFGDSYAAPLFTPFVLDHLGFSKTELALFNKAIGFGGTVLGAAAGAALATRHGLARMLVCFGILQAATNLLFSALAVVGKSYGLFVAAIFIDNTANSLGTAVFLAFLLTLTEKSVSATQYALLTALSSVGQRFFGWSTGYVVASVGWAGFYATTALLALPGLLLIPFVPIDEMQSQARKKEQAAHQY
ncbi:MAG: MFS transporter [Pseudomonadota bacterium]